MRDFSYVSSEARQGSMTPPLKRQHEQDPKDIFLRHYPYLSLEPVEFNPGQYFNHLWQGSAVSSSPLDRTGFRNDEICDLPFRNIVHPLEPATIHSSCATSGSNYASTAIFNILNDGTSANDVLLSASKPADDLAAISVQTLNSMTGISQGSEFSSVYQILSSELKDINSRAISIKVESKPQKTLARLAPKRVRVGEATSYDKSQILSGITAQAKRKRYNDKERSETALVRAIGGCIRCRTQRIRVSHLSLLNSSRYWVVAYMVESVIMIRPTH